MLDNQRHQMIDTEYREDPATIMEVRVDMGHLSAVGLIKWGFVRLVSLTIFIELDYLKKQVVPLVLVSTSDPLRF